MSDLGSIILVGFVICIIYLTYKIHYGDKPTEEEQKKMWDELAKNNEKFRQEMKIAKEAIKLFQEEKKKYIEMELADENNLFKLSPQDFEDFIAELFKRYGFKVTQTPYTNDRGKDAIMEKDNKKYVLECKHYSKDSSIGRPHLQKFFAAMHEEKAEKGYFITTCFFADTAIEYAKNNNIELIDLTKLKFMINEKFPNNKNNNHLVLVMC